MITTKKLFLFTFLVISFQNSFIQMISLAAPAELATPEDWVTVPVSEARELTLNTSNLFILDARTQDEYDGGHVEGAVLIPHAEVLTSDKLPADKATPILVYCRSGSRSAVASDSLVSLGYTIVWNMENGLLNGWLVAGYFVTVSTTEANYLLNSVSGLFIIDVRNASEYGENHVAGARNIPLDDLVDSSDLPAVKTVPLLVYSNTGNSSARACQVLENMGYTAVRNMGGGYREWTSAGYSTETTQYTTSETTLRSGSNTLLFLAVIIPVILVRKRKKRVN